MPIIEQSVRDMLPARGFIRDYVQYAENRTDANIAYHVGSALTLLATSAPDALEIDFGGKTKPNMFIICYGESTQSRKSSAVRLGARMQQLVHEGGVGSEPGSSEGLLESIRQHPRQTVYYNEFGHFLAKAEEGYMRPLKTMYNNVLDGAPLSRQLGGANTKSAKQNTPVSSHCVSLIAGCAPIYLEEHADYTDFTGGFLARFLMLAAPRTRYIEWPQPDQAEEERLAGMLREKYSKISVGKFRGLTPAADARWRAFSKDIEATRCDADELIIASVNRMQQMAVKIALICAWDFGGAWGNGINDFSDWWIDEPELNFAIAVANLHSDSCLEIGETLATNRDMRDRRKVLSLIPRTEGMELGQIIFRAKMLKRRCIEILATLSEEGSIVPAQVNGRQGWVRTLELPSERAGTRNRMELGTGKPAERLRLRRAAEAQAEAQRLLNANIATAGELAKTTNVIPIRPSGPVKIEEYGAKVIGARLVQPGEDGGEAPVTFDPNATMI